jgi:hypothetical protein
MHAGQAGSSDSPARESHSYRNGEQDRDMSRPHGLGFKPLSLAFAVPKLTATVSHNQPTPSDTVADYSHENFKENFPDLS